MPSPIRKISERVAAALTLILLLVSCSDTPSGVLDKEEMAALMADIHTAESVADMNHRLYQSDLSREELLQSIYIRHGVDAATVDSSLAWYGAHLDKYMDMYDRTIEILEQRLTETGNRIAAEAVSIAGDSVDVWPNPRFLSFRQGAPSNTVTFYFTADENWNSGDNYVWRSKVTSNGGSGSWALVTEYSDGSAESVTYSITGDGWKEISFDTDSTRVPTALYGYLTSEPRGEMPALFDSIQLVRRRVNAENYRRYQRPRRIPEYTRHQ